MLKIALASTTALMLFSGAAMAADLYIPPPETALAPALSAETIWDGPYIGAHLGYGPGTAQFPDDFAVDFSGGFVGLQAGYNFAVAPGIVLGIEGDISKTNESGTASFEESIPEGEVEPLVVPDSYEYTDQLNWTGGITGHVGFEVGNLLPYVLGGVAFANNTLTYNYGVQNPEDSDISSTNTHVGYVIGAGLGVKLADNLSAFGEVRYANYGSADYFSSDEESASVGLTDTSVRGGLNFHF